MTPQERDQLNQFLAKLRTARAGEKIAEAEALIREAVMSQPDAAYLLVQRAMLLEQALEAAKGRISRLENTDRSLSKDIAGNFLSQDPWAHAAAPTQPKAVPGAHDYQLPKGMSAHAPAANAATAPSFLSNMAATAAGVVAGSFLFQGIEQLLGHHPSGRHSDPGVPAEPPSAGDTVINNYHVSDGNEAWTDPSGDYFSSDVDADSGDDVGGSGWI